MKTSKTTLLFRSTRGTLYLYFPLFFALIIILSSCNHLDDFGGQGIGNEITLQEVVDALGGMQAIEALETMSYKVNSEAYEFEEEEPRQDNPILSRTYQFDLTTQLNSRILRLDYSTIDSYYPLTYSSSGATIIIDDRQGSISGQYDTGSYYFGAVQPRGLFAPRIESKLKTYAMGNPLELIKQLIEISPDLDLKTKKRVFTIPTGVANLVLSLHIDKKTALPTKVSTTEVDFINGDVTFEVNYENWSKSQSLAFPSNSKFVYNGDVIKKEFYSDFLFNPVLDATFFEVQPVAQVVPYNDDQSKKGIYHSQWYERYFDFSIASDQPLDLGFVAAGDWLNFGIPDQSVGENLKIIGRPDIAYWAAAVKTSEGVLIIESPFSPEWSRAIINTVKSPAGYPDEKITGLVQTHTHVDHFSGIREMASEVETIYIGKNGKQEVKAALKANSDILADTFSLSSQQTKVQDVEGITYLDGGAVELHSVTMTETTNNPHSENMLIVYIPEYEAIIQADLFSPGGLLAIYADQTLFPLDPNSKAAFKERAKFLLDYITEKELAVSRVIGVHGGLGSLQQLQFVANN